MSEIYTVPKPGEPLKFSQFYGHILFTLYLMDTQRFLAKSGDRTSVKINDKITLDMSEKQSMVELGAGNVETGHQTFRNLAAVGKG